MSRILPYVGALFLAQMLFVGLVHLFLVVQDKDSAETLSALHDLPVLGGWFLVPEDPEAPPGPEELRRLRARELLFETRDLFELPAPFEREEIAEVLRMARDARSRYTQELRRLEGEREQLAQLRTEIETERGELLEAGEELGRRAAELQAGMEELEFRANRLEAEETRNLRSVASIYERMAEEAAAAHLQELGEDTAAKILSRMSPRSSGKVLAQMPTPMAVAVTRRMQGLTREAAATDTGGGEED